MENYTGTDKFEFQVYEVYLILDALKELRNKSLQSCKWEIQEDGHYNYTLNRRVKQIDFVINSIKRQWNGED